MNSQQNIITQSVKRVFNLSNAFHGMIAGDGAQYLPGGEVEQVTM